MLGCPRQQMKERERNVAISLVVAFKTSYVTLWERVKTLVLCHTVREAQNVLCHTERGSKRWSCVTLREGQNVLCHTVTVSPVCQTVNRNAPVSLELLWRYGFGLCLRNSEAWTGNVQTNYSAKTLPTFHQTDPLNHPAIIINQSAQLCRNSGKAKQSFQTLNEIIMYCTDVFIRKGLWGSSVKNGTMLWRGQDDDSPYVSQLVTPITTVIKACGTPHKKK